jgi:hypothetical protein
MVMKSIILIFLLLITVCGASQTQSPKPLTLTPADLSKLRWIEGAWKGTGDIDKPFYERYRFEGDSLVVESYPDETFSKPSDVSRFELKDGQFGSTDGKTTSVATAFDENSITFVFVGKTNTFEWKRESADLWTAIIKWNAKDTGEAKQRVYKMERVPGK